MKILVYPNTDKQATIWGKQILPVQTCYIGISCSKQDVVPK